MSGQVIESCRSETEKKNEKKHRVLKLKNGRKTFGFAIQITSLRGVRAYPYQICRTARTFSTGFALRRFTLCGRPVFILQDSGLPLNYP